MRLVDHPEHLALWKKAWEGFEGFS